MKEIEKQNIELPLKCPLCEKRWTNNLGGGLTLHLKKEHKIDSVNKMIELFPDYIKHFNVKNRDQFNHDCEVKVQCKLCGKWLKEITLKHLKVEHSISSEEYRKKFGRYSQYSNVSLIKRRENIAKRTQESKTASFIRACDTRRKNGNLGWSSSSWNVKLLKELQDLGYNVLPEYIIPEISNRRPFDIFLVDKKILIEFQSTKIHADPRVYKEDDVVKVGIKGWKPKLARDIWAADEKKKKFAEKYGYRVLYLWEEDWNNREQFFKEIL